MNGRPVGSFWRAVVRRLLPGRRPSSSRTTAFRVARLENQLEAYRASFRVLSARVHELETERERGERITRGHLTALLEELEKQRAETRRFHSEMDHQRGRGGDTS